MFAEYVFIICGTIGGLCGLFTIGGLVLPILLFPIYKLDGGKMGLVKYYFTMLKEENW